MTCAFALVTWAPRVVMCCFACWTSWCKDSFLTTRPWAVPLALMWSMCGPGVDIRGLVGGFAIGMWGKVLCGMMLTAFSAHLCATRYYRLWAALPPLCPPTLPGMTSTVTTLCLWLYWFIPVLMKANFLKQQVRILAYSTPHDHI